MLKPMQRVLVVSDLSDVWNGKLATIVCRVGDTWIRRSFSHSTYDYLIPDAYHVSIDGVGAYAASDDVVDERRTLVGRQWLQPLDEDGKDAYEAGDVDLVRSLMSDNTHRQLAGR